MGELDVMSGQLNRAILTRRRFVQTLGVSAVGLAMAACASPAASPPSAAAPAQPPATTAPAAVAPGAFSGTSIRFGALANYKGDALEKTFPDFEKATGIKVQIDKLPNPNLADKLAVSFASGSPDYDVAMMDETWIAGLAPYLANVDTLVTRDSIDLKQYVPNGLSAGVYNSTRVAMPLDPNVMMLWYRKDLFAAKNVAAPATFDDVIAAAEKLNDPANGVAGISVSGGQDGQVSALVEFLLWNAGGEIITPEKKFGFDGPAGIQALQTYQRIIKSAPPGVLAYGYAEQINAFYTGKAAMVFYWASIGPDATNPDKSQVAKNVGWAAVPNAQRGVWNLGISKDSTNKDAAWEWVKWITGPTGSAEFTQFGGGHSPRFDVINSPDFQQRYPWAQDFQKALSGSRFRPQLPSWNAVDTVIMNMTTSVLSGQKQPEDAIKAADQQVASYLT
jgi:multiple sugar transport system substrate-binding protein